MISSHLFSGMVLGSLNLRNRIVMAPMTRLRAPGGVPSAAMTEYYRQRATAGLIVTECTMISDTSAAYIGAPGIFADEFIDPWHRVTDAVHDAGGRIFLQLWHGGRIAHTSLMPGGVDPLAPSAIAGDAELFTPTGLQPASMPRAISGDEVRGLTKAFGKAAERARKAGFDGVEIHGAFGYLIDQFLQDASNRRTDGYGGSFENRTRFLLGIVGAVQQAMGRDVGVKLSPSSRAHGMRDSDSKGLFAHVLEQLDDTDLAYVHMMEPSPSDLENDISIHDVAAYSRSHYDGTIIANGGFDLERANAAIDAGSADLVSFGQKFIANPDLVARLRDGRELASPDFALVYGKPGEPLEPGYTDYPTGHPIRPS